MNKNYFKIELLFNKKILIDTLKFYTPINIVVI